MKAGDIFHDRNYLMLVFSKGNYDTILMLPALSNNRAAKKSIMALERSAYR
jgi:hypothetical protein